jgi:cell division cycle 2-like protein
LTGETSSSVSSVSTVGERSPDEKHNTGDRETRGIQSIEPNPKRSKNDEEVEMISATNKDVVSDALPQEEFPPYMPAIQGCRSVGEFQCLNKIEEGMFFLISFVFS